MRYTFSTYRIWCWFFWSARALRQATLELRCTITQRQLPALHFTTQIAIRVEFDGPKCMRQRKFSARLTSNPYCESGSAFNTRLIAKAARRRLIKANSFAGWKYARAQAIKRKSWWPSRDRTRLTVGCNFAANYRVEDEGGKRFWVLTAPSGLQAFRTMPFL